MVKKIFFNGFLVVGLANMLNAAACADTNSQECAKMIKAICDGKSQYEKCKAKTIEFHKGGKLTTDGKLHMRDIANTDESLVINNVNGKPTLFLQADLLLEAKKFNDYTFMIEYPYFDDETGPDFSRIESRGCFAWDIKYKTIANLEECGKDDIKSLYFDQWKFR